MRASVRAVAALSGRMPCIADQRVSSPTHWSTNTFLTSDLDYGESRTGRLRYRLADPAARFHYRIALPMESAAVAFGAEHVWNTRIRHETFPTYVGRHVFEDVARQAYIRWAVEGVHVVLQVQIEDPELSFVEAASPGHFACKGSDPVGVGDVAAKVRVVVALHGTGIAVLGPLMPVVKFGEVDVWASFDERVPYPSRLILEKLEDLVAAGGSGAQGQDVGELGCSLHDEVRATAGVTETAVLTRRQLGQVR